MFLEDHGSGAETQESLSPEVSAVVLLDSDGAGTDFFIVFSIKRSYNIREQVLEATLMIS